MLLLSWKSSQVLHFPAKGYHGGCQFPLIFPKSPNLTLTKIELGTLTSPPAFPFGPCGPVSPFWPWRLNKNKHQNWTCMLLHPYHTTPSPLETNLRSGRALLSRGSCFTNGTLNEREKRLRFGFTSVHSATEQSACDPGSDWQETW